MGDERQCHSKTPQITDLQFNNGIDRDLHESAVLTAQKRTLDDRAGSRGAPIGGEKTHHPSRGRSATSATPARWRQFLVREVITDPKCGGGKAFEVLAAYGTNPDQRWR